ncbi:DUF2637 domain-containing protein [Streptomyces paludis]|uniref:DUF2637 domain-containing protein n=1 Tax=Streptomyces paludis TaxID=2282738 RepID=A0A345HRC3_9ACTN|nr:DUF2637 domain-containing protein [Streptomyces paludis]AXG79247.1 DUF2637 domain-containing protein [Streptomyces paludis]
MPSPTTAVTGMPPSASPLLPLAAAIRAGVALLAVAAFALSYDALRQMAAASHIHQALTYAFPLVIDGFIAIGIGALLVLRTAPLSARLYVSALVGIATATSIWANVLHAIRLNQQDRHTGLALDDITVGVISAIAPLALAGAVHFYLLVARRPAAPHGHNSERHTPDAGHKTTAGGQDSGSSPLPVAKADDVAKAATNQVAEPDSRPDTTGGRRPSISLKQAMDIGRTAPLGRAGRVSRRNIEKAVHAEELGIARSRLDEVKELLQAERDKAGTCTS